MADRRMLSGDTWQDEFVGGLTFFERLLWVGLITAVADDQGRFPANFHAIRAAIYLYDESVTSEKIKETIRKIVETGRLIEYRDDRGRVFYQLANWWKYQSLQWPQPSKYPAPEDWVDRVRYHTTGRKIVEENFDKPGGLPEGRRLRSGLASQLGSGVAYPIEKEEEEEESKSKRRVEQENSRGRILRLYETEIGALTPLIADDLQSAVEDYSEEWVEAAIREAVASNVRSWKYTSAILQRWKRDGFKSKRPESNGAASARKNGGNGTGAIARMRERLANGEDV